jgi:hypothetical protein
MIKCKFCGARVPGNMNFCASCGTRVKDAELTKNADSFGGDAAAAETVKKHVVNFKRIVFTVILVASAITAIALVSFIKPAKYEKFKSGKITVMQEDDRVAFFRMGENKFYIDGYIENHTMNLIGNKMAILVSEEPDGKSERFSLYLLQGKPQPQLVDEQVHKYWISASGNAVAYVKEFNSAEHIAELWLYLNGKKTLITSKFFYSGDCFVSPNASALCYTTPGDNGLIGYVWDGEEHELGTGNIPFAVADKCEYVYYETTDTKDICVQKGNKNDNKTILGEVLFHYITFNRDLSQVIFLSDFDTYLSRNGGEREKLGEMETYQIYPNGTAVWFFTYTYRILAIDNFANSFFENTDSELMHINSKYEINKIAESAGITFLADDGKTLTFDKDGSIYRVNGFSENAKPVEIVSDENITEFAATDDGSALFFQNEAKELYYQRGKEKPILVDENIWLESGTNLYECIFGGDTIYYKSDGAIYYSNGLKRNTVSGIEGKVLNFVVGIGGISLGTMDYGVVREYFSEDGKEFILLE